MTNLKTKGIYVARSSLGKVVKIDVHIVFSNSSSLNEDFLIDSVLKLGVDARVSTVLVSCDSVLLCPEPLITLCYKLSKTYGWKVALETQYSWEEIMGFRSNKDLKKAYFNRLLLSEYVDFLINSNNKIINIKKTLKKKKTVFWRRSLLSIAKEIINYVTF